MIFVVGATGLVGGEVARGLSRQGHALRLLTRKSVAATTLGCPGAEMLVGDLDDPSAWAAALDDVKGVLLVSPATPDMVRQQCNLITALAAAKPAREGNLPRVVKISGFMTSMDSASRSGRWHAQIEAEIEKAGFPFAFLRPPFFMQNLLRSLPQVLESGVLRMPAEAALIGMVDARDLAAVAVKCLVSDERSDRRLLITGPTAIDFDEVAAAISAWTTRNVSYQCVPEELTRMELEALGTPAWRVEVVEEVFRGFRAGLGAPVSSAVSDLTGAAPKSLAQFFADQTVPIEH